MMPASRRRCYRNPLKTPFFVMPVLRKRRSDFSGRLGLKRHRAGRISPDGVRVCPAKRQVARSIVKEYRFPPHNETRYRRRDRPARRQCRGSMLACRDQRIPSLRRAPLWSCRSQALWDLSEQFLDSPWYTNRSSIPRRYRACRRGPMRWGVVASPRGRSGCDYRNRPRRWRQEGRSGGESLAVERAAYSHCASVGSPPRDPNDHLQ